VKPGRLILIPTVISEGTQGVTIPLQVTTTVKPLRFFLAEDARSARRYLSSLKLFESIEALHISVLNKDTTPQELPELLKPLLEGNDMGILSESGCPGIADPGAIAVRFAHAHNIQVLPLVGPSSLVLALMAAGLNGQQFAFHGYLPIEARETVKKIKELEQESRLKNQTQIFIETPYRNTSLLDQLLKTLSYSTLLSIAIGLTGENESIKTQSVRDWKAHTPVLTKTPAVFCFLAV